MDLPPQIRDTILVDLGSGTWRYVKGILESRIHSAQAALCDPEVPPQQVDFHRGAMAVCRDVLQLVEVADAQHRTAKDARY